MVELQKIASCSEESEPQRGRENMKAENEDALGACMTVKIKSKSIIAKEDLNERYKLAELERPISLGADVAVRPIAVFRKVETRLIKNFLRMERHEKI